MTARIRRIRRKHPIPLITPGRALPDKAIDDVVGVVAVKEVAGTVEGEGVEVGAAVEEEVEVGAVEGEGVEVDAVEGEGVEVGAVEGEGVEVGAVVGEGVEVGAAEGADVGNAFAAKIRIRLLYVSATKTFPNASTATL
jgi:hypothetical protein